MLQPKKVSPMCSQLEKTFTRVRREQDLLARALHSFQICAIVHLLAER